MQHVQVDFYYTTTKNTKIPRQKKKKTHKSYILSQSPVLCVSETWRPHHFAAFFLFKWAQLLPEAWGPEQNLAWTRMGESLVSGLCVTNVRSCRRPRGNATASHDSSWPSSNHPTLHPMSAPIASVKPPPTHTTNQHSAQLVTSQCSQISWDPIRACCWALTRERQVESNQARGVEKWGRERQTDTEGKTQGDRGKKEEKKKKEKNPRKIERYTDEWRQSERKRFRQRCREEERFLTWPHLT